MINNEGFSNYTLENVSGSYPESAENVLLQDSFPITGKNGISDKQASDIWYEYPTFRVGSYDQITNNLKYPRNPDVGQCMPASVCNALYKNIENKSNYIEQLPPANPECGRRINYFNTNKDLLTFRTDMQNILY